MIMHNMLIILMITLISQHVHSKVITINTGGSDNSECCAEGECLCSSLSTALQDMDSNTIINITSEAFTLKDNILIGSGSVNNIMITSHMATVNCSNIIISCESCDDIRVDGITWVSCTFAISNTTVANCTLFDVSFMIVGSITIESVSISIDDLSIYNANYTGYVNLTISGSTFFSLSVSDSSCLAQWNITVVSSVIPGGGLTNLVGFDVCVNVLYGMHVMNTTVNSTVLYGIYLKLSATKGNVIVSISSSNFTDISGTPMKCMLTTHSKDSYASVVISDTELINNRGFSGPSSDSVPLVDLSTNCNITSIINLNNVNFTSNKLSSSTGTLSIVPTSCIEVNMTNVNFINNEYFKGREFDKTAAVYIKTVSTCNNSLIFNRCNIKNNTYSLGARAIYIDEYVQNNSKIYYNELTINNCNIFNNTIYNGEVMIYISGQSDYNISISNTTFSHNVMDDYIINAEVISVNICIFASNFISNNVRYGCMSIPKESFVFLISSQFFNNIGNCVSLTQARVVKVASSNFTRNIGSCIYLSRSYLKLAENTVFYNNTAEKGAALYIDQGTNVTIMEGAIKFLSNSASLGGAIFVDLSIVCLQNGVVFTGNTEVTFKDNLGYAGDSLYFRVSEKCNVTTNARDPTSLMYAPYQFRYSGLNATNCCDVSCSNQRNTKFPVITSPHHLILCGDSIRQLSYTTYYIDKVILEKPAIFKGYVMDYFKKHSQPVQFSSNCTTCPNDIKLSSSKYILVDNTSPLSLKFSGNNRNFAINVTITFTSFLDGVAYIQPIEVKVIVELVPCFKRVGYAYSKESNGCTCYHPSIVKCNEHYNEIEDGYWVGVISSQPTISLCPPHYCSFIHRKNITLGYSQLPDKIDAQCNHHRRGRACGECSEGYTLAYDTTDCITVNRCSTVLTLIVILSTCVYWLIIVGGVFTLLYFNRNVPYALGYTYGIIYYYSMVGFLFSNNLYVSDSGFLFVSVMSSFTQLSPQFLGKLCLFEGLSGIDQLFIHYSHAIAVSFLLITFIIVAKFSRKLSDFVSRCRIVRIICLLFLLSYTSIVSTSLQLLRPLRFTDIEEVYTYSSPSIQYFHDRHAVYGGVGIILELGVGIGLPLLLLLEPFINKYINFVKIKPFLDELQDCYKMKKKYRWFASYYLICRHVILLIVFVGNSYHDRMLFYLLIACVVMATVHLWVRPYESVSLNIFDGLILQAMVVGVSVNIFAFLQPAATELVVVLVILPLIIICVVGIGQLIRRKVIGGEYIESDKDFPRFVCCIVDR